MNILVRCHHYTLIEEKQRSVYVYMRCGWSDLKSGTVLGLVHTRKLNTDLSNLIRVATWKHQSDCLNQHEISQCEQVLGVLPRTRQLDEFRFILFP